MAQSTQWVMLSAVSLPNHTFTGQAQSSKRLTSIVHILSPETDNWSLWKTSDPGAGPFLTPGL